MRIWPACENARRSTIFESYGLSPQTAANIFPLTAVSMVISMPILGHLLDRFSTRLVFAAGLVCMTCASLTLAFVQGIISAVLYKDHAGENLALLRKMTLNVLKQDTSVRGGIHTKRLRAGWDIDYLVGLPVQAAPR